MQRKEVSVRLTSKLTTAQEEYRRPLEEQKKLHVPENFDGAPSADYRNMEVDGDHVPCLPNADDVKQTLSADEKLTDIKSRFIQALDAKRRRKETTAQSKGAKKDNQDEALDDIDDEVSLEKSFDQIMQAASEAAHARFQEALSNQHKKASVEATCGHSAAARVVDAGHG